MGACLGVSRDVGSDDLGGRGRERRRRRRRHRRHRDDSDRRDSSGAGDDLSDSVVSSSGAVLATKNRPLRHERVRWKSEAPLTEGQLKSKRDEFWDTAPAFEGKAEIWMALKAAAEAAESGREEDYELAQAILDGAGVLLPHGSLLECYDELGTRYAIPVYCLSKPLNLTSGDEEGGGSSGRDSPEEFSEPVPPEGGDAAAEGKDLRVRIRVSLTGGDVRTSLNTVETVGAAKRRLHEEHPDRIPERSRQRWYYGGKILRDRMKVGDAGISPGHVVQCVVGPEDEQQPTGADGGGKKHKDGGSKSKNKK